VRKYGVCFLCHALIGRAVRGGLCVNFDAVCIFFSEGIAVSEVPEYSRHCGQKMRKVQRSAEKFVRYSYQSDNHFVYIAERFEKKFHLSSLRPRL